VTLGERSLGNVTIVDIDGRITDEDDADLLLRDALQNLVQQGRVNLLLNLTGVPSVGSVALGAIAHAYTSATCRGGTLRLTGVSGRVYDLLTITRLRSVFEVFDSEADALASFATTRP
jgi:anti-sigma B factor antagonist